MFNKHSLQLYKYTFSGKNILCILNIRILLQEFNLETKFGPPRGNIDLLWTGLGVFGVKSFQKRK